MSKKSTTKYYESKKLLNWWPTYSVEKCKLREWYFWLREKIDGYKVTQDQINKYMLENEWN